MTQQIRRPAALQLVLPRTHLWALLSNYKRGTRLSTLSTARGRAGARTPLTEARPSAGVLSAHGQARYQPTRHAYGMKWFCMPTLQNHRSQMAESSSTGDQFVMVRYCLRLLKHGVVQSLLAKTVHENHWAVFMNAYWLRWRTRTCLKSNRAQLTWSKAQFISFHSTLQLWMLADPANKPTMCCTRPLVLQVHEESKFSPRLIPRS